MSAGDRGDDEWRKIVVSGSRSTRPRDLFCTLTEYFEYFKNAIEANLCSYEIGTEQCRISNGINGLFLENKIAWYDYVEALDDIFALHVHEVTASEDIHCNLVEPKVHACHPIEYAMFHICSSIMLDFIVLNLNATPHHLDIVCTYLQEQKVSVAHEHQFENNANLMFSVHVSDAIRHFWNRLNAIYRYPSAESKQGLWERVCNTVKLSICTCRLDDIRMDVRVDAKYKTTNPLLQAGFYKTETRLYRNSDPVHLSLVKSWEVNWNRDYTEKVFYLSRLDYACGSAIFKPVESTSSYLKSYRRVFDMFRLIWCNAPNTASYREITPAERRNFSVLYDSWGFAYSLMSLLETWRHSLHTAEDHANFQKSVAIGDGLLCSTIDFSRAMQLAQEVSLSWYDHNNLRYC